MWALFSFISGCSVYGSKNEPVLPPSTPTGKPDTVLLNFYLSGGILTKIAGVAQDVPITINWDPKKKEYLPNIDLLQCGSHYYMTVELVPGIHNFWYNLSSNITAKLDGGREYYLAAEYAANAIGFMLRPSLLFKNREEFLRDTREIKRAELGNWNGWSGYSIEYID